MAARVLGSLVGAVVAVEEQMGKHRGEVVAESWASPGLAVHMAAWLEDRTQGRLVLKAICFGVVIENVNGDGWCSGHHLRSNGGSGSGSGFDDQKQRRASS